MTAREILRAAGLPVSVETPLNRLLGRAVSRLPNYYGHSEDRHRRSGRSPR